MNSFSHHRSHLTYSVYLTFNFLKDTKLIHSVSSGKSNSRNLSLLNHLLPFSWFWTLFLLWILILSSQALASLVYLRIRTCTLLSFISTPLSVKTVNRDTAASKIRHPDLKGNNFKCAKVWDSRFRFVWTWLVGSKFYIALFEKPDWLYKDTKNKSKEDFECGVNGLISEGHQAIKLKLKQVRPEPPLTNSNMEQRSLLEKQYST